MAGLTAAQVVTVARAGVLLAHAAHVLSEFEVETVFGVLTRFHRQGPAMAVTDAEWGVVESAEQAMTAALALPAAQPRAA